MILKTHIRARNQLKFKFRTLNRLFQITVASLKYDFEDSTGEDLKAVQMAFEYSKSLNFFLDVC